jgi:hypothetical protein
MPECGADRLAAYIRAEATGHVRIKITNRTACFEQRPGGVKENRFKHRAKLGPRPSKKH